MASTDIDALDVPWIVSLEFLACWCRSLGSFLFFVLSITLRYYHTFVFLP